MDITEFQRKYCIFVWCTAKGNTTYLFESPNLEYVRDPLILKAFMDVCGECCHHKNERPVSDEQYCCGPYGSTSFVGTEALRNAGVACASIALYDPNIIP